MKCEICGKGNANAWLKNKMICQRCWRIHKYGDMANYIRSLRKSEKRKLKGGEE